MVVSAASVPVIPVVCESYHRLFDGKTRMERGMLKVKGRCLALYNVLGIRQRFFAFANAVPLLSLHVPLLSLLVSRSLDGRQSSRQSPPRE